MEIGWKRKTGPLRARGARAAFPSLGAASANAGRAAKRKNTMAPQRDWRVASATVAVVAAVFVALSLTPAPAAAQFPVPQKCTCWKPNGPYGTQQGRRVLPARARRRSVWSFLDMGAQFFATSCWWGALANTKKNSADPFKYVGCYATSSTIGANTISYPTEWGKFTATKCAATCRSSNSGTVRPAPGLRETDN